MYSHSGEIKFDYCVVQVYFLTSCWHILMGFWALFSAKWSLEGLNHNERCLGFSSLAHGCPWGVQRDLLLNNVFFWCFSCHSFPLMPSHSSVRKMLNLVFKISSKQSCDDAEQQYILCWGNKIMKCAGKCRIQNKGHLRQKAEKKVEQVICWCPPSLRIWIWNRIWWMVVVLELSVFWTWIE